MILHSTGGLSPKVGFPEAIVNGIAPDGGLYMPDSLPQLPQAFFRNIQDMSLCDVGFVVMNSLLGDTVASSCLKELCDEALDFDMPLRTVGDNLFLLELFHGPTATFKDVGARVMARLLPMLSPVPPGDHRVILMATSGDSGGAVANAFSAVERTDVVVLFPKGGISDDELRRFASIGNVHAVEVDGLFDDCQALVKSALQADAASGEHRLTAGNSINLARQLPSVICFFHAYARIVAATERRSGIVVSIPCGNLGSLAAALMAKRMGLPVERFIAANNANDVFVEYLKTGGFRPKRSLLTIARAMDVGNPSNIGRIIDLYGGDLEALRRDVEGYAYSDDEIACTMAEALANNHIRLDPQGATALRALYRHLRPGETGIAFATGLPPGAVQTSAGAMPGRARHSSSSPRCRVLKIPPTLSALNRILASVL